VIEQVFSGQDAFFGEHLRDGRSDATHILNLIAEAGHIWMLNGLHAEKQTRCKVVVRVGYNKLKVRRTTNLQLILTIVIPSLLILVGIFSQQRTIQQH